MTVAHLDDPGEAWDQAVSRFQGSSFCHLAAWRSIMAEVLGHRPYYWTAVDGEGVIRGVLPLVHVRSRLFGNYLLSMPFLSYGGPLGCEAARRQLVQKAVDEARRLRVDLLELRSRSPLPGSLSVSDRKITVLKSLPESEASLWEDGIRAKVRSQIRRPMKEGMEVRFGTHLIDEFYDVFARTMRDLGTPVLTRRFFRAIVGALGEHVVVAVVDLEGRPVAAGCGFSWQGELEVTWAGALREHSKMSPNMLLYWSLMEEAVRRRCGTFNFGRCTRDSGTHRFKRQWGTEDHPLPWAQWSPRGVAATPSPDSPKYRMATAVWRRLPLALTNSIGPHLSRSLP